MIKDPFRNGHMRKRNPCTVCEAPTRRTVLRSYGVRYVLCSRCELPSAEERLLMAVFGVSTLPALERKLERAS